MEEEIEVVRSELRGSTGELVSYRESLDSAEGLINNLQTELHDRRAQVSCSYVRSMASGWRRKSCFCFSLSVFVCVCVCVCV